MLRHQLGMAVNQPLIQIKEDKMNQIKSTSEVTLTDLRRIGLQGDATARLASGEEVKLTSKHGLIPKKVMWQENFNQLKWLWNTRKYTEKYAQSNVVMF